MRTFRLQVGTGCLFLMVRHRRMVCLFALVAIPQSLVTGPIFLVSHFLVYELMYSALE